MEGEDDDPDANKIGNGVYSVTMRLKRGLPQFVPMYGKRITLKHFGITKMCTNCYGPHIRKWCKEEKVPWLQYVEGFMKRFPKVPRDYYGRWADKVEDYSNWQELKRVETTKPGEKKKTSDRGHTQDALPADRGGTHEVTGNTGGDDDSNVTSNAEKKNQNA